jgi:carboxyl-terminal processing protease
MLKKLLIAGYILICLPWYFNTVFGQFNDQGLKFMKLFSLIESRYVDTLNIDKLSDGTIRDMLHKLDPHSVYITKEEVEAMNEPLVGNFEGIGVTFNIFNDTILIVSPIPGGPSEKLGIRAGDRIIKIADERMAGIGITTNQVYSKLRGKKGTVVKVDIQRHGVNDLISFSITRDKIPIYSVDAAYKIDGTTGYIRLSRFSATTIREVREALNKFKKEGIVNIILDLSDNGGGYLDAAVAMADEFLDADKLIVYTSGAHTEKREYLSTSGGLYEKGKLVIIIDENTASASEIVAGAIQDWDRGLIVGRRSFGKGLVQNPFSFPDGSLIRLTIARYYTPTGRLIQKPYTEGYEEYSKELNVRVSHGELLHKDSIHNAQALPYYTKIQKRKVFGGGGITPDVFVPVDTAAYSISYQRIIAKGILNNFVLSYIDSNRDDLKNKYSDFNLFKNNFKVDSSLLKNLLTYAAQKSLTFKPADYEKSKKALSVMLKASIARDIWGSSEFFEIYNPTNQSFIKAMETLSNWDRIFSK